MWDAIAPVLMLGIPSGAWEVGMVAGWRLRWSLECSLIGSNKEFRVTNKVTNGLGNICNIILWTCHIIIELSCIEWGTRNCNQVYMRKYFNLINFLRFKYSCMFHIFYSPSAQYDAVSANNRQIKVINWIDL